MAGPRYIDRVRETCAAPGTGTVMLLGAALAYQAFGSKLSDGDTCFVTIADQAGPNWEVSLATYHAGGTLTRTAGNVLDGSAGQGVLVNFSGGVQDVFLDAPATLLPTGALSLVPASRQVIAGNGLSGGGTLDNNVVMALPPVGAAGTFGDSLHAVAFTVDAYGRVTGAATSATALVPATRQVLAGTGLSGGGALSADLTVSMPNVGTAGTYGDAGHVPQFTTDAQGRITSVASLGIGTAIGNAVSGGVAGELLFPDSGQNLAQDADLFWDITNKQLLVRSNGGAYLGIIGGRSHTAQFSDGTRSAQFANGIEAGRFSDGTHAVNLCDGTNTINYSPANPGIWPLPGSPTDVWVALDTLAAALAAGGASNPLTTKGDLYGYSTAAARVPAGSNGQVLTADSTQTTGLHWTTPFADPTTTKGDVIIHGSSTTRFGVGSDGQVLTADSTQALGVKWAAASGGSSNSRGAFGSRPAAATAGAGAIYLATDGPLLSESDGSTWAIFGPVSQLTDPTAPAFAWQDQGSATVTTSGGVVVLKSPGSGSDSINARVVSLPSAGTAYTVTALVENFCPSVSGYESGLCLTDGTKYIVFFCSFRGIGVRKFNSTSSFNGNYTFPSGFGPGARMWYRIADAGGSSTNAVTFQVSVDGLNWVTLLTRNRGDFLTESKIGWYVNNNNGTFLSGLTIPAALYSWSGP